MSIFVHHIFMAGLISLSVYVYIYIHEYFLKKNIVKSQHNDTMTNSVQYHTNSMYEFIVMGDYHRPTATFPEVCTIFSPYSPE